jgi:hypothetical protein
MADLLQALIRLRPGVQCTNTDNTYEGIVWPEGFTPPSKADFEKELARADVPQEVWAGAMMRALNTLGILEQIDQIVAAQGDLLMKKLWDRAAAFRRDDPMVTEVGMAAGWTEKDLDDLFRLAGSFSS